MLTLTSLTWIGMPSRIVGNGSVVTTRSAVVGSTWIAALTTTVPRLYGPVTAGTTTDKPNGSPPYGPVRYTLPPVTYSGLGPGPAATVVSPIWLAAEQVPCAACGSPHNGTSFKEPS